MISESTHWYDSNGKPRYEATLREAKKEQLLPSVTSITSILEKPFLTYWKQEQTALATQIIDRYDYEDEKQWMSAVMEEASKISRNATDIGKEVHSFLENALLDNTYDIDPPPEADIQSFAVLEKLRNLLIPGTIELEAPFALTEKGWAGKIDCIAEMKGVGKCLLDFKTQNTKDGKFTIYDSWGYQLAGYNEFAQVPVDNIFSVIISTNPSFPIYQIYRWDAIDSKSTGQVHSIKQSKNIFFHLYEVFRLYKKLYYLPTNWEEL